MVLQEIIQIFERRRQELYNLLVQRKDEIKPEIQHQIYGAINEIDMFLKTIEYYKQKETDHEINKAVLVGPMLQEDGFTKFMKKLNHKISHINSRFMRKNKQHK